MWVATGQTDSEGRTLWRNHQTGMICVKRMLLNKQGVKKAKYVAPKY